jgi:hypothetical protein
VVLPSCCAAIKAKPAPSVVALLTADLLVSFPSGRDGTYRIREEKKNKNDNK